MEIIIDAKGTIAGRLGQFAAKQALLGNTIKIINSEHAIISGNKTNIVAKYKRHRDEGTPFKGPFISRMPDRFLRRMIRGMLPYKQGRGKVAYANIMCYIGVPAELADKKPVELAANTQLKNSNIERYVTVNDVCRALGGKL